MQSDVTMLFSRRRGSNSQPLEESWCECKAKSLKNSSDITDDTSGTGHMQLASELSSTQFLGMSVSVEESHLRSQFMPKATTGKRSELCVGKQRAGAEEKCIWHEMRKGNTNDQGLMTNERPPCFTSRRGSTRKYTSLPRSLVPKAVEGQMD
ncbi:predicted protein [Sclerotinia sclerotiorum 1980 UF-70]|uniref:Uncharacterized protein n=1 Tax=Sclerotinia sclerotiorum (strain ATCC 18683 / 1980 / Ss-1) TaxID=665079 RepID=A7EYI0_SCLS1|nr:predicted protein [Sclerotinia sclerotiorum 1980 UF-70]EDN94522.1 predicted protein [Sclerotinia sclerotiorum 1980 UF-70]